MIGTKLGRYEIVAKLGAGGMGEVYRAKDLSLGRNVALKVLPEQVRDDPERLRRFEQEARAASALNHPNIITIYDIGQADGVPYIAMELVEGHTLRLLLGRPLLTKRALALAAQAAEGLARAHSVGIVHRDLKPENLMVTRDGFLKILDFGLAKLHEMDPILASDAPTEPGTHPGVLLGTVGYMSPEQARGRPLDFRSDQFACGAILYEMATGRRAFERETPVQTLAAIIDSEPEPIQSLNPDVPAPFRWIVERCLKKTPDDRYASTVDLAHELRTVHDRLEEMSGSASGSRSLPPLGPRPRRWLAPAAALAAAAVVGAAMALWRIGPPVARAAPQAVAVLPIKNLSGQAQDDYLSIAIADAVMTRLAEIPSLSVVDRSTVREHRAAADDPVKAARDMGAGYVVTGSVQHTDGRLAVSMRLVRADSSVTWARDYESDPQELFGLQKQIALDLSGALKLKLTSSERQRVERPPTANADAYADYLQARAFLERPDVAENVERAITIFERAIAKDPDFALAQAGLGEAYWERYLATHDPVWTTKAQSAILEALRLDPEQPQVRVSLALIHQGTGHPEAAIEELRQALALRPDSDDAHRLLGTLLESQGKKQEAIRELQTAVELRPSYWRNHSQLGNVYFRMGRYPEAIACFQRVTELQPDNTRGFQMLGTAYQAAGLDGEALENYQKALAIAPNAFAYSNIGTLHYAAGRYAEAVTAYEKAVELDPMTPLKHRNLGDAYQRTGHTQKARAAYRHAVELSDGLLAVNPRDVRTLSLRAVCRAKLGDFAEAQRDIDAAVLMAPRDPDTLYRQAVVRVLGRSYDEAVTTLKRAIAAGYSPRAIATDTDFEPLRSRPDWAPLVKPWK